MNKKTLVDIIWRSLSKAQITKLSTVNPQGFLDIEDRYIGFIKKFDVTWIKKNSLCLILGRRRSGKTSLAKHLIKTVLGTFKEPNGIIYKFPSGDLNFWIGCSNGKDYYYCIDDHDRDKRIESVVQTNFEYGNVFQIFATDSWGAIGVLTLADYTFIFSEMGENIINFLYRCYFSQIKMKNGDTLTLIYFTQIIRALPFGTCLVVGKNRTECFSYNSVTNTPLYFAPYHTYCANLQII